MKRLPTKIVGAIDLSFLEEGKAGGLEALKDPKRFTAPSVEALIDGIRTDKLDLEMAMNDDETASFQNAISNKTWRALRQVRASDLSLLDKVDPSKDIEEVFNSAPVEPTLDAVSVVLEENGGDGDGGAAPTVTVTDGEEQKAKPVDESAPAELAAAS